MKLPLKSFWCWHLLIACTFVSFVVVSADGDQDIDLPDIPWEWIFGGPDQDDTSAEVGGQGSSASRSEEESFEANDDELSGPNVCNRQVTESVFVRQREAYPCQQSHPISCRRCRHNCRRGHHGCYEVRRRTCYRTRMRCVPRFVTKRFCCHGYEEAGGTCRQTIRCSTNNGGCDHMCRSDGATGHRCECFNGFMLVNRTKCTDVNECTVRNGGCDQVCTNTAGSFYCHCKNGYYLTSPLVCTEIDECADGNGGCAHNCVNTDDAFYCTCDRGFRVVRGFECEGEFEVDPETRTIPEYTTPIYGEGVNGQGRKNKGRRLIPAAQIGAIVGATVGVLLLASLIALTVFIARRYGRNPPPQTPSGPPGPPGPYEPACSAHRDSPEGYNNHAYDKLGKPLVPLGLPVEHLEPPPSYVEATAPPAESNAYEVFMPTEEEEGERGSAVYEQVDIIYDNDVPPITEAPTIADIHYDNIGTGTKSSRAALPPAPLHQESDNAYAAPVPTVGVTDLALAMKNLKKVEPNY